MANFGIRRLQISDSDEVDRNILLRADQCLSYESTDYLDATTSWATASHADVPFDLTNSVEAGHSPHTELSFPSGEIEGERLAKCWQSNYHEAAIFLEEGENNDKLDFHPCSREALPAYLVVHNILFYCLDLLSATVLMALALMEAPAVPGLSVPVALHVSVEILALSVVAVELCMKLRWMGLKPFFTHKRTVFKLSILLLMLLEALVVAARQATHFRILRALRPIFLIDNHYLGGVRRLTRQILQSLPPVFDMLVILFFFMTVFAILGYHIFSFVNNQPYFSTLYDSLVNLFVLLTTSNFPDVMIPYYANSKWAALFFVVFLLVHLYFLMNLVLAVVYERFSSLEKEKFRKLLLHRRKACLQAFRLLVNRSSPSCLYFCHFEGLMKYYKPRAERRDVYLMFKSMDTAKNGFLSQEEFFQVYEASKLTWERKWSDYPWFNELKRPFERKLFEGAYKLITWKWSNVVIYLVIAASFLWHIVEITQLTNGSSFLQDGRTGFSAWLLVGLLIFYLTEMLLKIAAFGAADYFHKGWNKFDFVVIVAAVLFGSIGAFLDANLLRILIFRSLRLLKLFQLKKNYHDVLGTVFILMPRFVSVGVVLVIVYYFFAIIGIEVFSQYVMEDCCKNTTVEVYFATNTSSGPGYFYLMNFHNLANSCVTLFALMAVNNWFIIMDGYVAVTSEFSRLFFMSFYLITMLVLQIVVAFVLEAFIFRIQYKMKIGKGGKEDNLVRVETTMSRAELQFCNAPPEVSRNPQPLNYDMDSSSQKLLFRGVRWKTKFSFCLKMYADETKEWLDHAELEERRSNEWLVLNMQSSEAEGGNRWEGNNANRRTFTL